MRISEVTINSQLDYENPGDVATLITTIDETNNPSVVLVGAAWNKYILNHMHELYDPVTRRLDLEKLRSTYHDLIIHYGVIAPGTFYVKANYGAFNSVNCHCCERKVSVQIAE